MKILAQFLASIGILMIMLIGSAVVFGLWLAIVLDMVDRLRA